MRRPALLLNLTLAFSVVLVASSSQAGDKEKKKEPRKGTAIGVLVAKGENFIEVRADGEEAPRKYVPQWKGGAPKDGGGPDKEMLKTFASLKIGSRIELQWMFEERLRAIAIKVLDAPKEKAK